MKHSQDSPGKWGLEAETVRKLQGPRTCRIDECAPVIAGRTGASSPLLLFGLFVRIAALEMVWNGYVSRYIISGDDFSA